MPAHHIHSEPLTAEGYLPFGEVIAARVDRPATDANRGTSRRYDHLCRMENLRPETTLLNVCVFRATATTENPLPLFVLEKHPYSTQTFAPLAGAGKYLIVVAEGDETPDLDSLRAFVVAGPVAISYRPGVWHHPLIALEPRETPAHFLCHIYEERTGEFPENQNTVEWEDPEGEIPRTRVSIA